MTKLLQNLFVLVLTTLPLWAQTNASVRLALVSENDPAASAVDVLTAQISSNPRVQLLERDQIAKVYQEQSLSAASADFLKLGQVLGADGLVLVQSTMDGTNQYLNVRLVAVRPGVVLLAEKVIWPVANPAEWATALAGHLDPFLPKLKVQSKDAIPLSVVNLRSAASSAEARETERQLKVLAIQRLSREPRLFVLERQKMALLGEEKTLKADESTFWNGSWLVEGVVDQNGYSPDTITIDAQLTPPKGAAPVRFTASGSRTNLAEVINQLALQLAAALQINATVKEWSAAAEAQQYFDEAQWALRWGVYSEAQSAADSAWALGRHDPDCARLRVQTYMVSPDAGKTVIEYPPTDPPDPQIIADATHALEVYNEISRNLPLEEPKVDSDWYRLGLDDLTVASRVLQVYNWSPDFYTAVAEKLGDLRAAAREAAAWISRSPSVHDSYYVGDQVVVYDNLHHFEELPSIFSVKLDCASLWQERPEDALEVYRELLASPVFSYFHNRFWLRDGHNGGALRVGSPRLVAWNTADQQRIPGIWKGFVQELKTSTNLLWQLEGGALELADINDGKIMGPVFTNFFSTLFAHRAELVAIPAEILYLQWHTSGLVEHSGSWTNEEAMEALQQIYQKEYVPKLDAMDREYQNTTVAGAKNSADFAAQKQYLAANKPYDFFEFVTLFQSRDYSKRAAREIQPLIAAYQANLAAQVQVATGIQKAQLQGGLAQMQFLAAEVDRILNPPAPNLQSPVVAQNPVRVVGKAPQTESSVTAAATPPDQVTNVIVARQFYAIPQDDLAPLAAGERVDADSSRVTINAHHWQEGRLVLDFHYNQLIDLLDGNSHVTDMRNVQGNAIALLDPATGQWEMMPVPQADLPTQNRFYHRTTLLNGEVFTCEGGQIQKYDRQNQRWQALPVSDGVNYQLFAVAGKLYAAGQSQIFEIAEDGKSMHLLASNRRQPPACPLDTEDLGDPLLFAGPDHSLRVTTKHKIYAWTSDNWQVVCAAAPVSLAREFGNAGALFVTDGWNLPGCVSRLLATSNQVEYCLGQSGGPGRMAGAAVVPNFRWKWTATMLLGDLPAALRQNDLYLLADHAEGRDVLAEGQQVLTGKRMSSKNGYEAVLLCFADNLPSPLYVYLRFDNPDGCPPVTGQNLAAPFMPPALPPGWMEFTPGRLICGLENPDRWMPGAADKVDSHYKAGVWVLPVGPIDAALAPQIEQQQQAQRLQKVKSLAEAEAAQKQKLITEQFQKDFLNKYDRNHNGVLDPEERTEAKDDPDYSRYMLNILRARNKTQ